MKIKILAVLVIVNISIIKAQSGWTRAKGSGYFKLAAYTINGEEYYGADGTYNLANNYHQQALTLYGEYGITKNITAIINYPFLKFQNFDGYNSSSGTGNPQIELKFPIFKKFPVVAFSLGAEIPIATQTNVIYSKELNPFGNYDYFNLPTGYPDFSYWGTLAASGSWGKLPGWTSIYTQYTIRGTGYSNILKTGIEVGYKWTPKFYTNVRLVGFFQAQKNIKAKSGSLTNGQGTEFTTIGLGAGYKFYKNLGVTLDYQFYNDLLVSRKNVYSTPLYQLGISYEF